MKTKAIHGNSKITSSGFIITTPIHNILYLSSITRDLLYHILNSLIFKNSVSYPWFCSHSLANWQQYYIHTMCVYIYMYIYIHTHTHTPQKQQTNNKKETFMLAFKWKTISLQQWIFPTSESSLVPLRWSIPPAQVKLLSTYCGATPTSTDTIELCCNLSIQYQLLQGLYFSPPQVVSHTK